MRWKIVGIIIVCVVVFIGLKYLAIPLPVVNPMSNTSSVVKITATIQKNQKYKVETIAEGLNIPWSIVFTAKNRILVTERSGNIRVIKDGVLEEKPLRSFSDIFAKDEEGLMGLGIDPDYEKNHLLYACISYENGTNQNLKIIRFIDQQDTVTDQVLLESIASAPNHAGCRVKFGPDKKLYITTGDATNKKLPQDTKSWNGKIIQMNSDGSSPKVYALGMRNSQGIDWDPITGTLWATDHGPSGFDGPGGGDEINLITEGGNYGWPIVSHEQKKEGYIAPKLVFTPAVAPASLLFYKGTTFPGFTNDLFFGGLRGTGIYRIILTSDRQSVDTWEKLSDVNVGRVRDIVQGPDGYIYFSTSNLDGRGKRMAGDDKIYRLVP